MGNRDSLWRDVLDRYGLPTLLSCCLLWYVNAEARANREERTATIGKLTEVVQAQTATLQQLAAEERAHAAAVGTVLATRATP